MSNFSSKILKNKKLIAFVFLFLIIFGISFSKTTHAFWPFTGKSIGQAVNDTASYMVSGIFAAIAWAADYICQAADYIFSQVLSVIMLLPITTDEAFLAGWATVKDLANMFIVLGFVIVGMATALRIREYEAKKLLKPLIIVALFINFSGLICGLGIDAANITIKGLHGEANANMGSSIRLNINATWNKVMTDEAAQINLMAYCANAIVFALLYLGTALVFLFMSIILIARYVMLGILFVLSPLAFVCYIFGFTKKYFDMWLQKYLHWLLLGVGGIFFLNIASGMLAKIKWTTDMNMTEFNLLKVLLFVIAGFLMSMKASGIGSKTLIGLASGGIGMALGGVGAIAGATGLKGLAQRGAAAAKDTATGASEKYLGKYSPVARGTTAKNKASRLEEPMKRLDSIQDNQQLAKIAEQSAITHEQAQDKAAAAALLAKRNAFNAVNPTKRDAVAAHATAFGVPKDTFTKPEPKTFTDTTDKEAIAMIRAQRAAQQVPQLQQLGMSPEAARKSAVKSAQQIVPTADEITKARVSLKQRKVTENALGVLPVSDRDVSNKLVEDRQKLLIEEAKQAGRTMLPEEAQTLTKNYRPDSAEITLARENLGQERIQKAVKKLAPRKAAELPTEAVSAETISALSGNQLTEGIQRFGGQNFIDELKKYSTPGTPEHRAFLSHHTKLMNEGKTQEAQELAHKVLNIISTF